MTVRVQEADFDTGAELAALRAGDARVGALASFLGLVRDLNDGASVAEMTLEHYPGMTEKALEVIVAEAKGRWDIYDALVIHRVGPLKPCDQDRAGRRDQCPSRRSLRCLRIHHGLPEDPGAVLEEGSDGQWRALGRCAGNRRQCGGALAEVKRGSAGSLFAERKNLSAKSLGLAR